VGLPAGSCARSAEIARADTAGTLSPGHPWRYRRGMANIVESIAQSVSSLGVKASYGDPVTVGGVEIIPVALVWYGYGGGFDHDHDHDTDGGGGGGGGGVSIPVGAYVPGLDGVRFAPNPVALIGVCVPLAVAASWAIVGTAILGRRR
jgi:hypothetical protein